MPSKTVYLLNALLVWIIIVVLVSAFGVQLFLHEQPCPLCFLQRLGMTGVAIGALMNMRFGVQLKHYSLILFSSMFGGLVALRQIALHVCPGDPAFGLPVLGLSLYVWSFIVFVCTVAYIALLLFISEKESAKSEWNRFSKLTGWIFLLVTLSNFLTALHLCGLGPCMD